MTTPLPTRAAAMFVLGLLLVASGSARAKARDTADCETQKALCALNRLKGTVGCEVDAARRGTPVDPDCTLRVDLRFDSTSGGVIPRGCMTKAEAGSTTVPCLTRGDAPAIAAKIDALVAELKGTLYVNPGPTEQNLCWAKQADCVSDYARRTLACYRRSVSSGGKIRPGCVEGAARAFSNGSGTGCMDKLDAAGHPCSVAGVPGQAVGVEATVDAFLADLRAELMPDHVFQIVTRMGEGSCATVSAGANPLLDLDCGEIAIGGGTSAMPPAFAPVGSASAFAVVDAAVVGVPQSWGARRCSSAGCPFGAPLPIDIGPLSTCVHIDFTSAASGALDAKLGSFAGNLSLEATPTLTLTPGQPCPRCVGGACDATALNPGDACQADASTGESHDCPAAGPVLSPLVVNLIGITTGTASASGAGGLFCPGQTDAGALGQTAATAIDASGSPAGSLTAGQPAKDATLASVFCVPATGNALSDPALGLPGPGVLTLPVAADLR